MEVLKALLVALEIVGVVTVAFEEPGVECEIMEALVTVSPDRRLRFL